MAIDDGVALACRNLAWSARLDAEVHCGDCLIGVSSDACLEVFVWRWPEM